MVRLEVDIYKKRSGESTITLEQGIYPTKVEAFRRIREPWTTVSYTQDEGMTTNGTTIYFPAHRVKEYRIIEDN